MELWQADIAKKWFHKKLFLYSKVYFSKTNQIDLSKKQINWQLLAGLELLIDGSVNFDSCIEIVLVWKCQKLHHVEFFYTFKTVLLQNHYSDFFYQDLNHQLFFFRMRLNKKSCWFCSSRFLESWKVEEAKNCNQFQRIDVFFHFQNSISRSLPASLVRCTSQITLESHWLLKWSFFNASESWFLKKKFENCRE